MLRLFILCILITGGLSLSAQEATVKKSCSPSVQCQAVKMATVNCVQPKVTTVATTTTPAPVRAASNTPVTPLPIFQLTRLDGKAINCDPADCPKICLPSNCRPTNGNKNVSTASARTTIAMKQE